MHLAFRVAACNPEHRSAKKLLQLRFEAQRFGHSEVASYTSAAKAISP
jgi:hypothetical protein